MALAKQNKRFEIDPEEEYQALLRSIRWTKGFGLLFVQCSPAEGSRLIARVRKDLPGKTIEVLKLEKSIDNLYDLVDDLPNKDQIDTLFIQGIEHSLYEYEKTKLWDETAEQYNYSEKGLPRILGHLNLARERFRDNFKIFFIFLVPKFALKYLIRRAPDFFDWRSGVLEFPTPQGILQDEVQHFLQNSEHQVYDSLVKKDYAKKILTIQAWLNEKSLPKEHELDLLVDQYSLLIASGDYSTDKNHESQEPLSEQSHPEDKELETVRFAIVGVIFAKAGRYERAIIYFDKLVSLTPYDEEAWKNRGICLYKLQRYEDAMISFEQALALNPNDEETYYYLGILLNKLGRCEEAIVSFDKALQLKADDYHSWNSRGYALLNLDRYEEAIASFDKTLQLKADDYEAWYNRGISLNNLGRYEEAIASYDQAVEINPDYHDAWYNKACCYGLQKQAELAIDFLKQAIELNPKNREMAKTDSDFDSIRNDDRFQALINETEL